MRDARPTAMQVVLWLLLGAAMPLFSAVAHSAESPGYIVIDPIPPPDRSRKVEVVEFFSYGCPHCAAIEPRVRAWEQGIDTSRVEFKRVHATYSPLMKWLARGFYTGEILGVTQHVHAAVFREIHEKGFALEGRTVEGLAALYARTGLDTDEFLQVARTDKVDILLEDADRRQRLYKVDRTPTLIVAGKYRVTAESAGGEGRMFVVVDELIRREIAIASQQPGQLNLSY